MSSHHVARLRLLALCVTVACRTAVLAFVSVHAIKVLQAGEYGNYQSGTLAAWLGLCSLPALILTPFIGPLASSRWNRFVMVGGSAVVIVVLIWAITDTDVMWLSVAGVLALEAAFFAAAVLGSISAFTNNTATGPVIARLLLVWSAIVGVGVVAANFEFSWFVSATPALALAAIALLAVVFGRVSPLKPLSLERGFVKPFLAGARDAVSHRRSRYALVGLWLWFFVAVAAIMALVRVSGKVAIDATWVFVLAIAVGALFSGLNRNSFRHGGVIPYAAVGAAICCIWWRFDAASEWPLAGLGGALGLSLSPLLHFYQTWSESKYHGIGAALLWAGCSMGAIVLAIVLFQLGDDPAAVRRAILNALIGVSVIAVVGAFRMFFRPAVEMTAELLIWPIYRVHAYGPDVARLPVRGPALVIGNHAAWFDPLFVAKVLTIPTTPMMTSKFYDLPILSWLMRRVIGTIRVPDVPFRHEAPELAEAVAALDRGDCIVLFPEGYLRRKEEQPLRRFGRGVWKILADRPTTPVFACWIDGNWGSFLSYRGGPPTKGKRMDFWRRIRIGIIGPIQVDPATLADHMATRTFLMHQVLAARAPLGLEPIALPTDAEHGDGE